MTAAPGRAAPRVTFCELPDRFDPADEAAWEPFERQVSAQAPDLLVLNELPFGTWLAASPLYDPHLAADNVSDHRFGLEKMAKLGLPALLTSRSVAGPSKLANEAVLLRDGQCTPIHHKHYFPEEPGFHEQTWFAATRAGFDIIEAGALRIGVLLCTEVMFTEWARHYRRQGANLIAVPRTSGVSMHYWHTAAAMAAMISGCYVVSSNRAAVPGSKPVFGGGGFAFSPRGMLLKSTSAQEPFASIDVDLDLVRQAQAAYPCYVEEITAPAAARRG